MKELSHLFANNRAWAGEICARDPEFFQKLSHQQSPQYLWIGCSDSRVPANEIVGLMPGELFVHRNIANIVPAADLNCLSVLQFAVDVLKVRHVIVCGHYGCAGIKAVLRGDRLGLVDAWLENVREVWRKHETELAALSDEAQRANRFCELNVVEQVASVCAAECVRNAWARKQFLAVHGWIYAVTDGLLRDLDLCVTGPKS